MKKAINISVIILFLIAICTVEQVLSTTCFKNMNEKVENLYTEFLTVENINDTKLISDTNEFAEYWTKKENILCTFVNHKDMENLGIEVNKMQSAVKDSNTEQYQQSIELIKFYLQGYKHTIGISFQNIF